MLPRIRRPMIPAATSAIWIMFIVRYRLSCRPSRRPASLGGFRLLRCAPGLALVLLAEQRLEVELAEQRVAAFLVALFGILFAGTDHRLGDVAHRGAGLAGAVGFDESLA